MYVLLTLPAGVVLEGIVLHLSEDRMRIVVPEFSDSLELRHVEEQWALDGTAVEFDFLSDMADVAVAQPAGDRALAPGCAAAAVS